jgi:hypothetical protein
MDSGKSALRDVYVRSRDAFDRGDFPEARRMLFLGIESFSSLHGDDPSLIKPLVLAARIVHRSTETVEEAHRLADRAVLIASQYEQPPRRLAETLCLVALLEWDNGCIDRAIDAHGKGIEEGRRAGVDEKWLAYQLTGITEMLLDAGREPTEVLSYAVQATELATRAHGSESKAAFFARYALGRAQIVAGMTMEGESTLVRLLEQRLRDRASSVGRQDKMAAELKEWIARAKGPGDPSPYVS